jgi:hypothetical protein
MRAIIIDQNCKGHGSVRRVEQPLEVHRGDGAYGAGAEQRDDSRVVRCVAVVEGDAYASGAVPVGGGAVLGGGVEDGAAARRVDAPNGV